MSFFFIFFERRNFIKKQSIQKWLPYETVSEDGLIICKNKIIKILKIIPINYELKSELEKEAILEAYKLFLRVCNFDIQILIQSKKEDISQNILKIKEEDNEKIDNIKNEYIFFLESLSSKNNSSSKNFFILINIFLDNSQINLKEKILKVEETLSKCGNTVLEINSRKEVIEILNSFFNPKKKGE